MRPVRQGQSRQKGILARRAEKDQIVPAEVIHGHESTALELGGNVEFTEHPGEIENRHDFTGTCATVVYLDRSGLQKQARVDG